MAQDEVHFFDAHTHAQFGAFDADRDAVLARAREAGVWMVNAGTQRDTSRVAVELAEREAAAGNQGVFAAIGLHPVHTAKSFHDADELGGGEAARAFTSRGEIFDAEYYRALALRPKTVAIGECGLDYFHFSDDEPREAQVRKQKDAFLAQIALAEEVKKPLMIHCRDAFADLIAMLKENKTKLDAAPGIVHFFTGTTDDARELLNLGFSFTFGGAITFPPRKGQAAGSYDEVVKLIPADRMLSETDAPYVAPAAYRGKRNEPTYVVEVVRKLAGLKGLSPDAMKAQIWENARRVYNIP
ncbi:MAG TPA: TatD family hydrolase [Candidatus Paceibacterota bacterium]|nr:TatD family hydrolase [Candidatus Paceibacterota bacterium]